MWGTGRGYLDDILRSHGIEVETLHDWPMCCLGGERQNRNESSGELRDVVLKKGCVLGLAPMETQIVLGSLTEMGPS